MVMKEEQSLFIWLIVGFSIFIYAIMPMLINAAAKNFSYAFLVFAIGYSIFVLRFIFEKPMTTGNLLGIFLIFLAGDIIIPPLLVTPAGIPPNLPSEAKFASEIFIYSHLPQALDNNVKYFLTYILIPVVMLFFAKMLLTKSMFKHSLF